MPEVTFTISPDGSDVKVDAEGFVGGGCQDVEKRVVAALGYKTDGGKKPEFFGSAGSGVNIGS